MHMQVVRSNDPFCVQRCSDWIALDGPIGIGSAAKFAKLVHSLGKRALPVLVNSKGGSVSDAMAMGRLIRARHLDVAVSKTELTTCPADRGECRSLSAPGVVTATPVSTHALCASACSFILAGGDRRFVALDTFVGVHQFRSFRTLTRVMRTFRIFTRTVNGVTREVSRTLVAVRPVSTTKVAVATTDAQYDQAQHYFEAMGITPKLMALAEETAPDSIHWLTLAELFSTRMDTEGKDGAYLIAHAKGSVEPQPRPEPQVAHVGDLAFQGLDRAELISDGPSEPDRLHIDGHALWSVDPTPSGPALLATLELPNDVGGISVKIVDLGSLPGVPDYQIKLTFHPGPQSPFGQVSALGLPAVRIVPQQPPVELQAIIEPPMLGTYDIDLVTQGPAADTNRRVLKSGQALEFPLTVYPLRNLRIVLPLGRAERNAFQRWRALVDEKLLAG